MSSYKNYSRLLRGEFRYATILPKGCSYLILVRASGEAILGTQRYFPKAFLITISSRLRRGDFWFWLRGGRSSLWRLTFIKEGGFNNMKSGPHGGQYRIDRKSNFQKGFLIRLASKFEGMRICKFEGSKRYFSTRFHIKVCSCLRRDGFRYTTIHSKGFPYSNLFAPPARRF